MKRFIATVFLLLYLYNFLGYIAVFSFLQYRVRTEIKRMLKESVPTSELVLFSFHTPSLEAKEYPLQWIEHHEFRYDGGLFDIVRSYTREDTTYFLCINDTREEQLFENLDEHVQREIGHSSRQGALDAFKNVFNDSITPLCEETPALLSVGSVTPSTPVEYHSLVLDVPFPPPRFS